MYETVDAVQAQTYPDLWRKGRYRVQLSAELPSDLLDVDAVLEELGYHVVDIDQDGRSYHHAGDDRRTAALDELEYESGPVRLTLCRGNLDEAETAGAEEELVCLLERIRRALRTYDADPCLPDYGWADDHRQSAPAAPGPETVGGPRCYR